GTGRKATLNLKFIGTSADVDFAQRRDFQSGFEGVNSRGRSDTAPEALPNSKDSPLSNSSN
ncbi:hypothetical protein, partial [Pseudomonas sp. NFACC45]|uniref:hypothetical protein n=1 Tax=Pseudomonas sp. NFACC45 TaxID=1566201 RepID=UPI001C43396A